MAFHVACPITCRRICYCSLGFPRKLQSEEAKREFLKDVLRVEEFLKDPWLVKAKENDTVQVKVPKVVVVTPPAPPNPSVPAIVTPPPSAGVNPVGTAPALKQQVAAVTADDGDGGVKDGGEDMALASAQTKRVALQKRAAAASLVAEDYARRFESGDLAVAGSVKDTSGEELGQSNVKVLCRLCFCGENEGSERARKMLSCKSCSKKYHRNCLKAWSQHRDLFHWTSWTCPSCRTCEVCRRTGDPNKFMFCKRCDGAYHCYCQQPPHKNVSSGPYLCPKHTRCHSCNSSVPGNGLSVRWFLGYTCCDACGRLFVKGNYCPVCLKVYRDSESTPMVCCDVCQRWVHCQCDGISDEKYLQFQVDGNLQYKCATCRGECHQIRNLEEAVRELWRRRDETDKDLIASLRAAAGLPTQEEIFSILPFSDDEDNGPSGAKNEYGRSLKLSLKGLIDKSPKKSKEYGKKSSNKKFSKKKGHQTSLTEPPQSIGHSDAPSLGQGIDDNKNEDMLSYPSGEPDDSSSPVGGHLNEGNHAGLLKHKFSDDITTNNGTKSSRTIQIKNNKAHGSNTVEPAGNHVGMSKTTKGPKLVIHLGGRSRNVTSSPRSDASSYQKEQEMTTSNGSDDFGHQKLNEYMDQQDFAAKFGGKKGDKLEQSDLVRGSKVRGKEGNSITLRKSIAGVTDLTPKFGGLKSSDSHEVPVPNTRSYLGRRSTEGRAGNEALAARGHRIAAVKHAEGRPTGSGDLNDDSSSAPSGAHSLTKDTKPLLKLKFKKSYPEIQNSWASSGEDEKTIAKGQRSKRKRPSPIREKAPSKGDEDTSQWHGDNALDEMMDASWILQKLGKDAIGKRVEVHQPSDNSWHRGTVIEVFEGSSTVSVAMDDGKAMNLELGKQGVRFVSQKQRR